MRIVVGLGNPGEEYALTRHNAGFEVVARLGSRHAAPLVHDRRLRARVGRGRIGDHEVTFLEPLDFMNLSGPVVARVVRERELPLADLLVVSDDFHLPLGELRLRTQGSAGGHNGLRSLIASLGTDAFPRLRIGIGEAPPGGAEAFVLTRFKPAERATMADAYERGADCVEDWCRLGAEAAMTRHNRKTTPTED